MTFPALKEAEGKLKAKQDELGAIFTEAGEDLDFTKVKSVTGTSREISAHVRKLNDEMADIASEVADLQAVQKAAERARTAPDTRSESGSEPGSRPNGQRQTKSLGQLFVESKAFKDKSGANGPEATLDIELKTLFQTGLYGATIGWDPEEIRTGRVVDFATRPIQITDLVPQTTTSQAAVQYMEETTFTNAAAEVAESTTAAAGTYPEAALALTERSSIVRKIAVFLPVTDEQLEDVPQARGYVDNRLPFMIRQRLDSQILVGSGVAPQLTGVLNVAGIQTQAKGTDTTPDAVYKGIVKVRVTGRALPNAVVMHPNDWQDIRLLRTADGIYIWGNPSDAGPLRIWGLNVVESDAITENTGLVGDFANFIELAVRRGIDVQVSNSHGSFFIEGKQAMRADMRVALPVYRPAAFCTVTGI
ncbi:phage major capsid protein [Tenggerimyces flavus]|uniref:Phage major capsid protein n=1 Tax=Tenggerimyces flavus TaxID=1708749 RepID=A0ABV7Y9M5_9ACTN|nr:phage major capsid protein [Tenggerimyces flavus]MBM7788860.1 HK97 family phage major capsid protein [Tenggerimyces flavus]